MDKEAAAGVGVRKAEIVKQEIASETSDYIRYHQIIAGDCVGSIRKEKALEERAG